MSVEKDETDGLTRRDALRVGAGAAGSLAFFGGLLGPALSTMAAPAVPGRFRRIAAVEPPYCDP